MKKINLCYLVIMFVFVFVFSHTVNASEFVSQSYLTTEPEVPSVNNEWKVSAPEDSKRTVFAVGEEVYYCMNSVLVINDNHYYKIEFYKGDEIVWGNADTSIRDAWGTYSDYYTSNVSNEPGEYTWKFFYSYDGETWVLDDEIPFTVLEEVTLCIPYFIGENEGWADTLRVDNLTNSKNSFTLTLYSGGSEVYSNLYLLEPLESIEVEVQNVATASYGEIVCLQKSLNASVDFSSNSFSVNFELGDTAEDLNFYFPSASTELNYIILSNSSSELMNVELIAMSNGVQVESTTLNVNVKTGMLLDLRSLFTTSGQIKNVIVSSENGQLSGFSFFSDANLTNFQCRPARAIMGF